MTRNEIIDRMAAKQLNISCYKFNNKILTDEEKDKVSEFCGELYEVITEADIQDSARIEQDSD